MDKKTLINLMDIMIGLSKEEINILNNKSFDEVNNEYSLKFLDQNEKQLEVIYERMN